MIQLNHVSLFTGIGGIDLAAEAAGFNTKAQVEIDPFCRELLAVRFPNAQQFADVREVKGGDLLEAANGHIKVMSGGFPCQPVSLAGKRQGSTDSRWLWDEYFRLIRECKPDWILAENVAALISIPEFSQIYTDLTGEGYEIGVFILSAADVGAPHQRKRCFIIANTDGERLQEMQSHAVRPSAEKSVFTSICGSHQCGTYQIVNPVSVSGLQTDSAAVAKREVRETRDVFTGFTGNGCSLSDWKTYPPAICRMDDGISHRLDKYRLQALGNAVVPRCAYPFFECIREIEGGNLR